MVNGQVILKHGRDKNVRAHHPWVFSGAVDKVKGKPLSGESVEVRTASGDLLGIGAWSPASQIQVRLWSFTDASIDRDFFVQRIQQALAYRQALGIPQHSSGYRLINAESDGLPGVVVDVFGDWLIMQALTAGAEYWKHTIAEALLSLIPAQGVYERSDAVSYTHLDVYKRQCRGCVHLEPNFGALWSHGGVMWGKPVDPGAQ